MPMSVSALSSWHHIPIGSRNSIIDRAGVLQEHFASWLPLLRIQLTISHWISPHGAEKKKQAGKKTAASSALSSEVGDETDSFGAFIDAATAQLNQAALQPGSKSAALMIFDSEAMYVELTELKLESYAVMQAEANHAVALHEFNHAVPSKVELGKYLQHMRQMLQQQHGFKAQVAMHLQVGQHIEYEALIRHINKASQQTTRS